jgi:ribosome biogenesis protein SSF1/2
LYSQQQQRVHGRLVSVEKETGCQVCRSLAQMMAPNTATALKESRRNQLKDFLNVAGPLGVTHFLILTATHNASYLRIAK